MNREDFPILSTGLIYFDNGATTLKPKSVVEKMTDYYYNYPANIHRGDYKISLKASDEYEKVRTKVKNFINASSEDEIVFTEGATDSLNRVVFCFMEDYLNSGDEVIISKAEHASAVLPWLILARGKNIKVVFVPLEENHELSYTTLEKYITAKTKVISLAAVTNVIGDVRDINKIGKLCHDRDILFVVDGAQSVPHQKTDVVKDNIDFLTFSAHKMLGPTGVGVLYAKKEYLEQNVSDELEQLMEDKEIYTSNENSNVSVPITKNDSNNKKYNAQVVYPIISNGDTIGTVILLSKEANTKMNEVETKIAQSAATFLGSQMEI